jgi:hypothetical protein
MCKNPTSLVVTAVLAALTLFFCGCGGGKTAAVNGRVKFKDGSDAKALAGYTVSFETEADRISGTGDIAPDGTFKITTYAANDGAVPGRHRVAISPPDPVPDAPPPKPLIPNKYMNFGTSGLTAEIKPGTTNNVELEVERAQ